MESFTLTGGSFSTNKNVLTDVMCVGCSSVLDVIYAPMCVCMFLCQYLYVRACVVLNSDCKKGVFP